MGYIEKWKQTPFLLIIYLNNLHINVSPMVYRSYLLLLLTSIAEF